MNYSGKKYIETSSAKRNGKWIFQIFGSFYRSIMIKSKKVKLNQLICIFLLDLLKTVQCK